MPSLTERLTAVEAARANAALLQERARQAFVQAERQIVGMDAQIALLRELMAEEPKKAKR